MVILTVIIVIISIVLVAVVLFQKSKGGGLTAGLQSSNQIMGAPKTADFLEKTTWTLMIAIAVLCIVSTKMANKVSDAPASAIEAQPYNSLQANPENITEEAPVVENEATEASAE